MENQNRKVNVFARIGVTLELTEKEITEFLSRYDELNEQERGAILRNAFIEGRVTIGGDTYIPVPSIDDVNDELGTDYEPDEYEFPCPDNAKILLEKQAPAVCDSGKIAADVAAAIKEYMMTIPASMFLNEDLISREQAYDAIVERCRHIRSHEATVGAGAGYSLEALNGVKPVSAVPRMVGRYIHSKGVKAYHYKCTACEAEVSLTGYPKFCTECGAVILSIENGRYIAYPWVKTDAEPYVLIQEKPGAPEEDEKTALRGGGFDPAASLQKFIEIWTVEDDASAVKPAEEGNHNLEVTCEVTMRESHMVTVGDAAYDMIKEGDIDAVRYLFGKTFMDCISDPDGTKTDTETDYAVYDCDTEMQVIDWD